MVLRLATDSTQNEGMADSGSGLSGMHMHGYMKCYKIIAAHSENKGNIHNRSKGLNDSSYGGLYQDSR